MFLICSGLEVSLWEMCIIAKSVPLQQVKAVADPGGVQQVRAPL